MIFQGAQKCNTSQSCLEPHAGTYDLATECLCVRAIESLDLDVRVHCCEDDEEEEGSDQQVFQF